MPIDPTENVKALVKLEVEHLHRDIKHIREVANLRAKHAKELSIAEAKRIDAIRAVDVNAVGVASERAAASAIVLATQVAQSADALRTLVATTAATMAEQQRQFSTALDSRLVSVERAQYEGKGKSQYTDPAIEKLVTTVERLVTSQSSTVGKSEGVSSTVAWIIAAITGLTAIVTAIALFMKP